MYFNNFFYLPPILRYPALRFHRIFVVQILFHRMSIEPWALQLNFSLSKSDAAICVGRVMVNLSLAITVTSATAESSLRIAFAMQAQAPHLLL